ncbi:MAG: fibronectin type III domain-containing protein, partial [Bacteroidota bacterium]
MKKLLMQLLVPSILLIAGNAKAQTTINNGGFENYDSYGTSSVEPTNWNSFMTADANILTSFGKKQRLNRTTVRRPGTSGSYSVVIWSTNEVGTIANGNLTTGKINMGSTSPTNSANYNFTKTSDANFRHNFTGHPDSLVMWVKFHPASNGSEQARVNAVIHDSYDYRDPSASDANSPSHVVGVATLNFTKTNGAWVRKSIPFNYTGPASTISYILITLTTNATPGGGSAGDSLYVDDMSVVYNPVLTTSAIAPATFYVSSTQSASVSIPFTLTGTMDAGNIVTAQLSAANGSFASPTNIGTLATTTSGTITGTIPANLPTGSGYRIRVVSSNYVLTAADNGVNLQIYNVGNSVAPSQPQSICQNSPGNTLTVTETPTATSREWKYATTSGGTYASFSPVQTGISLAPQFNASGTYYVICRSVIGGITINSQEVMISVAPQPSSGTLTPSPSVGVVCNGTLVSASLTPGSGGAGTTADVLEYRNDNGTWTTYNSGNQLNSAGLSTIDIRTYRTSSVSGCATSTPNQVSWTMALPSALSATNITTNSADFSWNDGNGSLWNIEYGAIGFQHGNGTLLQNISSSFYHLTGLTSGTNYSFYVQTNCGSGNSTWSGPFNFSTNASGQKTLNVKLFIEGLYAGSGLMNQAHNTTGPKFDGDVADVVTVELHNSSFPYETAYSFNNNDLHTNGISSINNIPLNITGNYYIVIKQRNSIETWSAAPINLNGNGPFNYDFSMSASQAYGNNQKLMTGGVYAIYSGNVTQDQSVDASDLAAVDNAVTSLMHGYYPEDINGDGTVDATD